MALIVTFSIILSYFRIEIVAKRALILTLDSKGLSNCQRKEYCEIVSYLSEYCTISQKKKRKSVQTYYLFFT